MAKKKSFILYIDRKKEVDMLTNEQAGLLFKAIMHYEETGEVLECEDIAVKVLFSVLRTQLDVNAEKYEESCKKRSISQKKRWNNQDDSKKTSPDKSKQVQTSSDNSRQVQTSSDKFTQAESDTDTVTDTVTDTETDTVSQSNETVPPLTDRLTSHNDPIRNALSKPMDFGVLLYNMRSPLYQEGYLSEDELADFSVEARCSSVCIIPESFKRNLQNMENALKYLVGFSNLKNQEFKNFVDTAVTAISETICTGQVSLSQSVDPDRLISLLNQINSNPDSSITQWFDDLAVHYSRKLKDKADSGQKIHHHYGFLKACAVSFLTEHRASDFYPGFRS